jgi:DNA processing protein
MQTDIKGGSMHTVRFTIQQGRLLLAPVPQGRHALEPKSQGILAMTQMAGPSFANAVRAEGDYRRILLDRYRTQPVAIALASKEDYASMLDRLEARLIASAGDSSIPQPQLSML